jgi:hypothetical protein
MTERERMRESGSESERERERERVLCWMKREAVDEVSHCTLYTDMQQWT